jgi:hypothetical protein
MTDNFPLPPELERLEQDLAARPRGQSSAQLKQRCLDSLRVELRREPARNRWAFAVAAAATVLVGLNLSLSASQATDCGLRLDGRQTSVVKTAEQIRQLLPDIPLQEAMRQAVLLRASTDVVPCPNVPARHVALDNNLKSFKPDF